MESFANCEEGIERTVREAAASLIKAGAVVCDVSIPMHADGRYSRGKYFQLSKLLLGFFIALCYGHRLLFSFSLKKSM